MGLKLSVHVSPELAAKIKAASIAEHVTVGAIMRRALNAQFGISETFDVTPLAGPNPRELEDNIPNGANL